MSPSVVGFEVSILFQAQQQDCGVFYETDLFFVVCGLADTLVKNEDRQKDVFMAAGLRM